MNRIRVLMIATPRLQTDLIRAALADEPAVELAGEAGADVTVEEVAAAGADLVIIGHDGGEDPPVLVLALLAALPRLKVLGVSATGGQAVLYELRPTARSLGEVSPRTLVAAIIGAVEARWGPA